jgi:hypothetical protein
LLLLEPREKTCDGLTVQFSFSKGICFSLVIFVHVTGTGIGFFFVCVCIPRLNHKQIELANAEEKMLGIQKQ